MIKESNSKAAKYAAEKLNEFIAKSGELVSEEEEEFRKEKCDGCQFNGIVEPLPGVKVKGCTACQCPFASKRRMKWIPRLKDSNDKPLSAMEILQMKVYGKFNRKRVVKKIIKCAHPDGDRWAGFEQQENQ